jgi:hypothetical protein
MFDGTIAVFPDRDHRSTVRRTVNFVASVRAAAAVVERAAISDLSITGCALESAVTLEVGQEVWIKLPGHVPLRAQVRWANGARAGCEFVSPLSEFDIQSLPQPVRRATKRLFTSPSFDASGLRAR